MSAHAFWPAFSIRVPGKFVLAGEHAVLRGATAVALPLSDRFLDLKFTPGGDTLETRPASSQPLIEDIVNSIEDHLQNSDRSFQRPKGQLSIESTIPLGAGLGSSAALCVALTRWMQEPLSLQDREVFEFARRLEHRFHGQSSGMDVAVILANTAISFSTTQGARPLFIKSIPAFGFHDTSLRTRTSDCIHRVEILRENDPARTYQIDEKMSAASRDATEGLMLFDRGEQERGIAFIARAMNKASECYEAWGLLPSAVLDQRAALLANGAKGVKLTGAGGGGFLISLS